MRQSDITDRKSVSQTDITGRQTDIRDRHNRQTVIQHYALFRPLTYALLKQIREETERSSRSLKAVCVCGQWAVALASWHSHIHALTQTQSTYTHTHRSLSPEPTRLADTTDSLTIPFCLCVLHSNIIHA